MFRSSLVRSRDSIYRRSFLVLHVLYVSSLGKKSVTMLATRVFPRCPQNPEQLHPEVQLHVTNVFQSRTCAMIFSVVVVGFVFFSLPPCVDFFFRKLIFHSCHRLVEEFLVADFCRNSWVFPSWFGTSGLLPS